MPHLPTDEQWRATIDGAPHLERLFWMPAGCDVDQARYRAVQIWSQASAYGSTPDFPVARIGLRLKKVAVVMAVPDLPALSVAA